MSKQKKQKQKPTEDDTGPDPHEVLRQPANPPRPNWLALVIALALFLAWFVYLVYVAVVG